MIVNVTEQEEEEDEGIPSMEELFSLAENINHYQSHII